MANNAFMEFVIRMRDEASRGVQRVRDSLAGAKTEANSTKPALDGLAGGLQKINEGASKARTALTGVIGVIGLIIAAWETSVRVATWFFEKCGLGEAKYREQAKESEKLLEKRAIITEKLIKYEEEQKNRIDEVSAGYDKESKALSEIISKTTALASARREAASATLQRKTTEIDTWQRQAVDAGYNQDAVKVMADDARRRLNADDEAESAKAALDLAKESLGIAKQRADIEARRVASLRMEAQGAKSDKDAAVRLLNSADSGALTESEVESRRTAATMAYEKAQRRKAIIDRRMNAAEAGRSGAESDVDTARAGVSAAEEAVAAAAAKRVDAEDQYQSEVAAFWQKQQAADQQARQDQLAAVREQMAERDRLAQESAKSDHERRVSAIRAEADIAEQSQAAAQSRLDRARSAAQQAWSWYKDPQSFSRQLASEQADADAEKRFEKDADSLQRRSRWRSRQLDAGDEAVRRVIVAREEQAAAQQSLAQIELNTRGLSDMLQRLLTMRGAS
jgi:hypothetical protein